jgi:hypothetical protein
MAFSMLSLASTEKIPDGDSKLPAGNLINALFFMHLSHSFPPCSVDVATTRGAGGYHYADHRRSIHKHHKAWNAPNDSPSPETFQVVR